MINYVLRWQPFWMEDRTAQFNFEKGPPKDYCDQSLVPIGQWFHSKTLTKNFPYGPM